MKTIHVVAAIIVKGNKIMIAKRNYGEFNGLYEFPGGKVEPGETKEEALKREIREELEVDIAIDRFFMKATYDYPTFHLDMDCYLCHLLDENIVLNDHSEMKWIDHNDESIEWLPANNQILDQLSKEIEWFK